MVQGITVLRKWILNLKWVGSVAIFIIHTHKLTYIHTYINTHNYNNASYIYYIKKIILFIFYFFRYLRCSYCYEVKNNNTN